MVSFSNQNISEFSFSEIKKIKQGRNIFVSAFLEFFDPFIKMLAREFARSNTFNFDELEQEGRIAALYAAKCFHSEESNFKYYIQKSIRNAIYLVGRRDKRRAGKGRLCYFSEFDPNQKFFTFSASSIHDGFEQVERMDALPVIKSKINSWRKGLSPQKQQIINLVFYKGMKQIQAASYLGLSRARIGQIMREILKSGKVCLRDIAELN